MGEFKLSKKVLASIVLLCFAGQVAWTVENQYFNVFLYNVIIPDPVYISYLVALSAVVSTVTSIVVGAYSDARVTRWGKRRPYLLLCYPIWGVVTALFPAAALLRPAVLAAWFAIFWDCLMTFFGAAAYDANFNAYVIDVTTVEDRGKVMGIVSVLSSLSLLLIYSFAGFFIETYGYFSFFYLVGVVVSFVGTLGALLVVEPPVQSGSQGSVLSRVRESFSLKFVEKHRDVFTLLLASSVQGLGVQVFFPYIILYLQHYLQYPLDLASVLMFIALLVGVVVAVPCGFLVDKLGRRRVVLASLPLCCLALYVFSLCRGVVETLGAGVAWVSLLTCNGVAVNAWLRDLYPEDKRGEFSGYNILFGVAFTMIPGPFIGSWLIRQYGVRSVVNGGEAFIPAPVIFQAGAVVMLASLPLILKVRETLYRKAA
ncbi:MAG: MFS transporter [Thermofilaceae archaeon]|nr:MFS transporter [Thermofilaceae archaeon]MDW8004127.1 MFS transporter [Thermofilaceae archaeon]